MSKIALFPSAFYPSLGGVEELSLRLAQAHQVAGHDVRVYTERWPRDLPGEDVHEGVEVRRFPFRVRDAPGFKPKLSWAASWYGTNKSLRHDLKAFEPDVVHIQCVSSAVDYALPAAKALGVPVVVTLQGELSMDADGIYKKPGGAQQRMYRALNQADAITGCSGQTLDEAEAFYIERGGKPFGERGQVIYNGIDLSVFKGVQPHQHVKPYVFALGRHVHQKGFDVLVRAMAQIPGEYDLILAGDGPDREALGKLVNELGLAKRIVFPGRIEPVDVRRYMKGAELFVLSSRHEPFGIVNLEAMASGTVVVATEVGGVPEFIKNEQTGILVSPEDSEEMALAIQELLSDQSRKQKLALAGQASATNFDWMVLANQYLDMYRVVESVNG